MQIITPYKLSAAINMLSTIRQEEMNEMELYDKSWHLYSYLANKIDAIYDYSS